MKARTEYFCQIIEQKTPLQIYCEKEFDRKRQAEYEIWLVDMEKIVKENLAYLSPPGEIYFEKKISVSLKRVRYKIQHNLTFLKLIIGWSFIALLSNDSVEIVFNLMAIILLKIIIHVIIEWRKPVKKGDLYV